MQYQELMSTILSSSLGGLFIDLSRQACIVIECEPQLAIRKSHIPRSKIKNSAPEYSNSKKMGKKEAMDKQE